MSLSIISISYFYSITFWRYIDNEIKITFFAGDHGPLAMGGRRAVFPGAGGDPGGILSPRGSDGPGGLGVKMASLWPFFQLSFLTFLVCRLNMCWEPRRLATKAAPLFPVGWNLVCGFCIWTTKTIPKTKLHSKVPRMSRASMDKTPNSKWWMGKKTTKGLSEC